MTIYFFKDKSYFFQILKKTAKQLLFADNLPTPTVDFTSVQLSLAERQSELSHSSRTGIPVVIADPETK